MQSAYFKPLPDEGPGERRGRKKRATAHRIFMSAIELMKEEGFDGVSVEQICDRARIARATFFQHFPSKAALLGLFSDLVRERIGQELEAEDLSAMDQLTLIADHLQRLADDMGPIFPDMLAAFTAEPGAGFRVDDPTTGVVSLVVRIVRRAQAEGSFAAHWPPEDVAISLVASWVAVARYSAANPQARSRGQLRGILQLHLSGLIAR